MPPLNPDTGLFRAMADLAERGEPYALATIIATEGSSPREAGTRMIVRADGTVMGTIGGGRLEEAVKREAAEVLESGEPRRPAYRLGPDLGMCCGGKVELLVEAIGVADRLYVFGGGHVALPLARYATDVGFAVTVVDDRADYANRERFPFVAAVHADDPLDFARDLHPGPEDSVVILTPEHRTDEELLAELVPKPMRYLGLIGSRSKIARFRLRLASRGIEADAWARVHAPIGLDIGAETPAEIAVAVVGELIRVRHRGAAGSREVESMAVASPSPED